ncbi:MAG: DUF4445 domain-containing protein [Armatimonadetes bacterium]|nr:DUF4445 domain-containing protein [Armatimonadota bacterium]
MTIAEAAGRAAVFISQPCGGRGSCGKCVVRCVEGNFSEPTAAEVRALGSERLAEGYRLACQARILGAATVEVPDTSRTLERKEISLILSRRFEFQPNVFECVVQVEPASITSQRADLDRLRAALTRRFALPPSLTALRSVPRAVRDAGGSVRVTAVNGRIVSVSPTGHPSGAFGAAVDLGTTTVVGYLFDLTTGDYLASATSYNPQARHGADVISRINYAMTSPDGLAELHREAIEVVNRVIAEAATTARLSLREIYEVTVVGNTCMHHLFLGVDPRYLGTSPYVPVLSEATEAEARDLGLDIHPSGNVFVLPVVAGFVGADTVAVILATELMQRPYPALAIDIGTNGEIALWTGKELLVASCAAGPAFEGAQIRDGVRAMPGAIEKVERGDDDIRLHTIGNLPAIGICGSGLFDAVAVLLDLGAIDASGRLADAVDGLPKGVAARIKPMGNERCVVLARAEETAGQRAVVLTQTDIRQVQLAKGAVRAAVELLLEHAGMTPDDLGEVLLAGAFGNYVNPLSILRMGLLPPKLDASRVHGVGNAAGAGAALALLSLGERQKAQEIARQAQHVELFTSPRFQDVFAEAMLFDGE